MPRYFFGENAGRPIRAGSRLHQFVILSLIGGTHQGVIKVEDQDAEAFIAVAGRQVDEISEDAYNDAIAKKKRDHRSRPMPDLQAPQRLGPPLKGAGAVVRDGAEVSNPKAAELPAKVDDAVSLGRADAPDIPVVPARRESKRANHKEKRGITAPAGDDSVEM